MKNILILLCILSFELSAKTVFMAPPEGYSLLWAFEPKNELEKKAIDAVRSYLSEKNEDIADYYLSSSKLDVSNSVYVFNVKHYSVFSKNKNTLKMPFKNGSFNFNVTDSSVSFIRE